MVWSFLKKIEPRLAYLLVVSFFALALLAAFLYVFRLPASEYFRLRQDRNFLAGRLAADGSPAGGISEVESRLEQMERQLRGDSPALAQNQLIAHVMERLDSSAHAHGVALTSLQPRPAARLREFEEIPFDVEVEGDFPDIRKWLGAVEQMIGPMVIKSFEITGSGERLAMRLGMASYRLAED